MLTARGLSCLKVKGNDKDKKVWGDLFKMGIHDLASDSKNK